MSSKDRRVRARCARAWVLAAACALLDGSPALAQQAPAAAEVAALNADVERLYGEGRFEEAIPLAERALSIQERTSGPDDPDTILALNNLALLYFAADDYPGAEALFSRILEITTAAVGPEDPAIAVTINNLGMLYWEQGDPARAEEYLGKALAIWERAYGPDHAQVAASLVNLASFYRKRGDYERAEPLYERALAIWEQSANPVHDHFAATLRDLGTIRQLDGDYERAEVYLKRALALEEEVRDRDDAATAVALSNLASLYYDSGDYARAASLLERALAAVENVRNADRLAVASVSSTLASVRMAMGEYRRAESLYERALEIRKQDLGLDHLAVAASLENLASLYRAQREFARAKSLCERALVVRVKALGPDHLDVARTSETLGAIHWALGDFARAEPLFARALLVREKALGAKHPIVAASVAQLASAYLVLDRRDEAERLFEAALEIREEAFGADHPAVAQSLRNLAVLHWANGDHARAERAFERVAAIEERQRTLLLPVQFDARAREFTDELATTTDLIVSFQRERPNLESTARLALTTVLRREWLRLGTALADSASLGLRLRSEDRAVMEALLAKRHELGRRIVRGGERPRSESIRAKIDNLRRDVDALEKSAAAGGSALRSWSTPIEIEDLQARIASDAALVEWVEYRDFDPKHFERDLARSTASLGAFVLRSEGEPKWIPLGESEAIRASARAFRKAILDVDFSSKKLRERARDLYDRLIAPLEPHLGGARTVWVAPDAAVLFVPFGALVGPDARYAVERIEFVYLTSGRDLLSPRSVPTHLGPPLVVAAPDFDAEPTAQSGVIADTSARSAIATAALHFDPLAMAQTGAAEVGRLLGVAPLTGARANYSAIRMARSPRVLHIATDAFFLPDPISEPPTRWGAILGVDRRFGSPTPGSPLLRSGLALAGANRPAHASNDGLLTSLEIARLDLTGTQLVAIEARGIQAEPAIAERAVFAFWRALRVAGAETQLANLWTPDARAARALTTAYYERLLAGAGRSEALREVQLAMLRSEDHSHPFHWASFIPIGARGPIVWEDAPVPAQESSAVP